MPCNVVNYSLIRPQLLSLFPHSGCVAARRYSNDSHHTEPCDNQESKDRHCQLGAQDMDNAHQGYQGVGQRLVSRHSTLQIRSSSHYPCSVPKYPPRNSLLFSHLPRYMCQINTDPMKSQMGYLDVVGKCKHRRHGLRHARKREKQNEKKKQNGKLLHFSISFVKQSYAPLPEQAIVRSSVRFPLVSRISV